MAPKARRKSAGISATRGLSGMNEMNLAASSAFVGRVLLVFDDAIAIEQLSESMQRFALLRRPPETGLLIPSDYDS